MSKVTHKASRIDSRGNVSALCFKTPRAINLAIASYADADDHLVDCWRCRKLMAARKAKHGITLATGKEKL